MNLKEKIFLWKQKKQPSRNAIFPKWDNIRNVLILYESDWTERNPIIKELTQVLFHEDKDVVCWGYIDKKDVQSPILPQTRILGKRDFGPFGCPKKDVIEDLQKRNYDLVIDLTQNEHLGMEYIAMYAQADFKTGRLKNQDTTKPHTDRAQTFDMLIEMPIQENPMVLYEQIVRYLQMIKPAK